MFNQRQYEANMMEKNPIGTEVMTLTANDMDGDDVRFSLIGPEEIVKYFYINPQTGKMTISRPLSETIKDDNDNKG